MKTLDEILESCRHTAEFAQLYRVITDVNQRGHSGDTPLHLASMWGDLEAVKILLAAGADVNAIGESDDTPLFSAVMGGNPEVVQYLVEQGCSTSLRNEDGKTALDVARLLQKGGRLGSPEVITVLELAGDNSSKF